jgi:hypothetical protein
VSLRPLIHEIPGQATDGVRQLFDVSRRFYGDTMQLWINGLERLPTDSNYGWSQYSSTSIALASPPPSGSKMILKYRPV